MAIFVTARYKVRPESIEKCKQAIQSFIRQIRLHEPHTRMYTALQDASDPTSFLHCMIFEDEAARECHRKDGATEHFVKILHLETVAPVEFAEYTIVATKE